VAVRVPGHWHSAPGEAVRLAWDAAAQHFFGDAGRRL